MNEPVAALALGLAAIGLLVAGVRGPVAVLLVFGVAYEVSVRYHAGTLDHGAWWLAAIAVPALFICWPRLIRVGIDDR